MPGKVIPIRREDSPPVKSDAELVAACADGDRAALGELYDRHHSVVWRFLVRNLGPSASTEIDDLVQSTFLAVWKSAPRFAGRSQARTWILGIAHNITRRHFRDGTRRRAALTLLANDAAPSHAPERAWEDRLMIQRMQAALQELSPDLRATFVLCDLEEVRGVDAAKVLGVRPGTVWRRLHEARKLLREALEGDDR